MKKSILTVSAFFVAISLSAFDFGGSLGKIRARGRRDG